MIPRWIIHDAVVVNPSVVASAASNASAAVAIAVETARTATPSALA